MDSSNAVSRISSATSAQPSSTCCVMSAVPTRYSFATIPYEKREVGSSVALTSGSGQFEFLGASIQ